MLVDGSDLEDTVGINVKDRFEFRSTTRSRHQSSQFKLAEEVVIGAHGAFTFVDWEFDNSWLSAAVVKTLVRCTGSGVARNNWGENVALHFNTKGQRDNVESNRSWVWPWPADPVKMAPWTAAPMQRLHQGRWDLSSSLPSKKSQRRDWILGIRVEPPTRTISST